MYVNDKIIFKEGIQDLGNLNVERTRGKFITNKFNKSKSTSNLSFYRNAFLIFNIFVFSKNSARSFPATSLLFSDMQSYYDLTLIVVKILAKSDFFVNEGEFFKQGAILVKRSDQLAFGQDWYFPRMMVQPDWLLVPYYDFQTIPSANKK